MYIFITLFIVAFVLIAVFSHLQAKKRREALNAWAASQGLSFSEARNRRYDDRHDFRCLHQGRNRYAYNIMEGDYDGRHIQAFDYHYEKESRDSDGNRSTSHYHFSAVIFKAKFPLEPLAIRPEHFFDKVSSFFGHDDIDFESAAFSKAYHVSAEDRRWAYDILHNQAIEWLMSHPKHHIEFSESHVLIAKGSKKFKPEDFELALNIIDGLLDRVPDYVKQKQQDRYDQA